MRRLGLMAWMGVVAVEKQIFDTSGKEIKVDGTGKTVKKK